MKTAKTAIITLPLTPAKFVKTKKIKNIAVFEMSCGGGMGGSYWKEYILDFEQSKIEGIGLKQFTNWNGEVIWLNVSNIVKISNYKGIVVEISHHNTNFSDNYRISTYICQINDNFKLVDDYNYYCNSNEYKAECVKTITELR